MSENNDKTTVLTGFQLNPQNINMNGRPPKEFSITNAFKEVLSEKNPETKIERYKELINKALTMAMRGDGDMIKYIINRLEGMPQGSASQVNVGVQVNYTPEDIKKDIIMWFQDSKVRQEDKQEVLEVINER